MYLLYYTTTRSAQKHIILFLFFIYLAPCTRSPVVDAVAFFSSLFSHHRYPFCHPLVSVSVSPPSVDEIESDHQNYVSAYHSAREHPPIHMSLPFFTRARAKGNRIDDSKHFLQLNHTAYSGRVQAKRWKKCIKIVCLKGIKSCTMGVYVLSGIIMYICAVTCPYI